MNTKQTIDSLWQELRNAINHAYKTEQDGKYTKAALHDYAEDIGWTDAMSALLGRETANERRHRSNRPSVAGFSNESAAKLILMHNALEGADKDSLPPATDFLICRQTAIEAQVVGFLARVFLPLEWRQAVKALDYAKSDAGRQVNASHFGRAFPHALC